MSASEVPGPAGRATHVALAVVLTTAALAVAVLPGGIAVVSPTLGGPRILTPGTTLEIVVQAGIPWLERVEAAALVHNGARVPLALTPGGGGPIQRAVALVPGGCPPGVWDLEVRAGRAVALAPHSVAVRDEIPTRFAIAQITDLHIGYAASSELLVERIVAELNAIGPALVVVSGDIANSGRWDEYRRAADILARLTAPIVTVPGNHDRRGRAGYLSTFGANLDPVRFGRWTIVRLDAGHGRDEFTLTQVRALERQLAGAGPGRVILLSHIPLAGHRSVQARTAMVADLLGRYRVPLVLSGHLHYETSYLMSDLPDQAAPTRFVVTATAGGNLVAGRDGERPSHGFRIVTIDGDRVGETTEHRVGGDGSDLDGEIGRLP